MRTLSDLQQRLNGICQELIDLGNLPNRTRYEIVTSDDRVYFGGHGLPETMRKVAAMRRNHFTNERLVVRISEG